MEHREHTVRKNKRKDVKGVLIWEKVLAWSNLWEKLFIARTTEAKNTNTIVNIVEKHFMRVYVIEIAGGGVSVRNLARLHIVINSRRRFGIQITKNRNKKAFVVGIITEYYTPEDSTSIINVFVLPQIIFLICEKCKNGVM